MFQIKRYEKMYVNLASHLTFVRTEIVTSGDNVRRRMGPSQPAKRPIEVATKDSRSSVGRSADWLELRAWDQISSGLDCTTAVTLLTVFLDSSRPSR
jgi:hypothetical protein